MPFYYRNGDTKFEVEDLSLDAWIRIQEATGLEWHECLGKPLIGNPKVSKAVLQECAAETGTTLPERLSPRVVLGLLVFEKGETVPTQFDDGMPDPKATDTAPATT